MKDWKRILAYGSATVLWFGSQLGLIDAPHVEAKHLQSNNQKFKSVDTDPIYLDKVSTIQSSLDDLFANDNLEQLAHYSHRSHRSHSSHSSHRSHYSHYSGTGGGGGGSGYYSSPPVSVVPEDAMDISTIQRKLNELGYDCGVVDGVKGTKTRESIRNFQMDYGLNIDGIVGPETKNRLESVDLSSIQKKLKQLGYDCTTDGIRNEKTIQAIKDFQAAEGLDSYGTINRVTKEAIENKEIPKPAPSQQANKQSQNNKYKF